MAKGEITIDERLCKGCGLCVQFCNRGCITQPPDSLSSTGIPLPMFTYPEKCNACTVCGWMCPDSAIEVYRYAGAKK